MRTKTIFITVLLLLSAISVFGQSNYGSNARVELGSEIAPKDSTKQRRFSNRLIAPKGEWQCGLSVMYADFSTSNTDYLLMLQGVNANGSLLRLAPEAAYTVKDNGAVGLKLQYTNLNGMLDTATADLLGNFEMSVGNLSASSRTMSSLVFYRTYVGLDKYGRVGIYWDYLLGYSHTKTQFAASEATSPLAVRNKVHLGFAPGLVYFPMNNVSIQASISLADISYSKIAAYESGALVGERHAWKAQASLNILNLNIGLTVHL